jgi:hypothetical protein
MFKHLHFLLICSCGEKGRMQKYSIMNYFQFHQQMLLHKRHKISPAQQTENAWGESGVPPCILILGSKQR